MFTRLQKARSLTTNQMRIVAAAIIGGMPELSGAGAILGSRRGDRGVQEPGLPLRG